MRDEEHNRSAPLPIDIQALARESRRIYLKDKAVLFVRVGINESEAYAGNAPVLIVHTINLAISRSVLRNSPSMPLHSILTTEPHSRSDAGPGEA